MLNLNIKVKSSVLFLLVSGVFAMNSPSTRAQEEEEAQAVKAYEEEAQAVKAYDKAVKAQAQAEEAQMLKAKTAKAETAIA